MTGKTIHPFLDGNGRVARRFTPAWFIKAHVDSDGLWTIPRDWPIERRSTAEDGRDYLLKHDLESDEWWLGRSW